jgi:hypothetical protein
MTKIAGSGSRIQDPDPGSGSESGSIWQRHGSADPDPDPHQNVMDRNTAVFNLVDTLTNLRKIQTLESSVTAFRKLDLQTLKMIILKTT